MEETLSIQAGQEIVVHEAKQAENLLVQILALDNAADFIPAGTLEPNHFKARFIQVTLQHAMDDRLDFAIAHAEVDRMVK